MESMKSELVRILKSFGISESTINEDKNLFADEYLDSMQAVDYLIMIEEKFGVSLTMKDVRELSLGKTSSLVEYLSTKVK